MTLPNTPQGALSHLKVLDLSRVLAGPWCTRLLADMGADVSQGGAAGRRRRHPPLGPALHARMRMATTRKHATYFTACNRNKRSITIDMAKPEGQALIRQMAAQSDILVENFKVGGLAHYRLGLRQPQGPQPPA